ncbi:MAG: tRNA (adenosine(37)-N6)-dimethylallyltransferase MiaA [Bacteroidales bacterium]|nr:tRNA (adenosine(37)-N6)-dimethylallyltransferase MiaA [Bacteroidales bacterium]
MMTIFVLLGPTAVGKTALSLQLAEQLGVSILNCDSRQIYREIPICTAAPTTEEQARVRHYFVGTHSLDDAYSAAQYETDVMQLLASSPADYLLSGGSMMYIDAVTKGIDDMPQADSAIREQLRQQYEAEGLQPLLLQLKELDPTYYDTVDRQNPQRVIHGLEMCLTTGRPFSTFRTGRSKERPFRVVKIGLRRDREELYRRIDLRVEQMFEQGLVEETFRVYERYQSSVDEQFASVVRNPGPTQKQSIPNLLPSALNTVGLKEMLLHFTGVYSLERAKERICHNSRVYSKKQMTWFQRDSSISWFHPDDADKILQFVSKNT